MGHGDLEGLRWGDYISAPVDQEKYGECHHACFSSFLEQRNFIKSLVDRHRPERLACLGAGYLHDIPIESIIETGSDLFLVDWIPDICEEGLRGSIIEEKHDLPSCLLCQTRNPERYCSEYRGPLSDNQLTCEAFIPVADPHLHCQNYSPASQPRFINHDVTAGVATTFADRSFQFLKRCKSPEEAFRRATRASSSFEETYNQIPIKSDSIDLVTSSMVASQFDHEPYSYFSKLLELKFGRETLMGKEKKLLPLMERLRAQLFQAQMEAHAKEIYRLVNKDDGLVFFSVELFRSDSKTGPYFLVQHIPKALEILSNFFFFDFQDIPPNTTLRKTELGSGISIIQSYVMKPQRDLSFFF